MISLPPSKSQLKSALSGVLAIALLGLLVTVASPGRILELLSEVAIGWYLLACTLSIVAYLPDVNRWIVLQRSVGYDPSRLATFEILATSYGLNKVLPANAGDLLRATISERYYEIDEHSELLSLVVVERVSDFLTVIVFFTMISVYLSTAFVPLSVYLAGGSVAVLVGGCLLLIESRHSRFVLELMPQRVRDQIQTAVEALRGVSGRTLLVVMGYTICRWVLAGSVFILVGRAVGQPIELTLALALVSGMSLISILPLTPGGIGPSETVGVGILLAGGVDSAVAVVLTLLQRSIGTLFAGALGVVLYGFRVVYPYS